MANAGRPKREFNKEEFEKLCQMQCTQEEICDFFDTTKKTLTKWVEENYKEDYSTVYKRKSEGGKTSCRRMLWKHAEKNAVACIFLSKNILGYKDVVETTMNVASEDDPFTKSLKESVGKNKDVK